MTTSHVMQAARLRQQTTFKVELLFSRNSLFFFIVHLTMQPKSVKTNLSSFLSSIILTFTLQWLRTIAVQPKSGLESRLKHRLQQTFLAQANMQKEITLNACCKSGLRILALSKAEEILHLAYSSVPNRRACRIINFEKKFPSARPYFGLHVYCF